MSVATVKNGTSTLSLVESICESLSLDLRGARVITEAATGPFAVTAAIAAFAGARVEAISADSNYGSAHEAASQTLAMSREFGVADRIQIVSRAEAAFEMGDIVTNLGSVRPIDRHIVTRLQPRTVIPVMYDARELRASDIDIDACRQRGVKVVGTFEEHPDFNIFRFIGPLALKLIRDFATTPQRGQIALVGNDLFSPYLNQSLEAECPKVVHLSHWEHLTERIVAETDLFVYSDYCGEMGSVSVYADPDVLRYPGKKGLLQFTGGLDAATMNANGWRLVPSRSIESHRMFHTLAYLGMEPVVELHACGLKTAEIVLKSLDEKAIGALASLCQRIC